MNLVPKLKKKNKQKKHKPKTTQEKIHPFYKH